MRGKNTVLVLCIYIADHAINIKCLYYKLNCRCSEDHKKCNGLHCRCSEDHERYFLFYFFTPKVVEACWVKTCYKTQV